MDLVSHAECTEKSSTATGCERLHEEIRARRVVAQGWPSTGDLSDLFGQPEKVVMIDPRISGLGGGGSRTLQNLLCRIHFGDIVIACEGNSVMGICEIGPSLIYGYDHSGYLSKMNPQLFGKNYFEYANALFFVEWIDWDDFKSVTARQPPGIGTRGARGIVYCGQDPQGILDAWNKYKKNQYKKSTRTLECCFGEGQLPPPKQALTKMTNHPECSYQILLK